MWGDYRLFQYGMLWRPVCRMLDVYVCLVLQQSAVEESQYAPAQSHPVRRKSQRQLTGEYYLYTYYSPFLTWSKGVVNLARNPTKLATLTILRRLVFP